VKHLPQHSTSISDLQDLEFLGKKKHGTVPESFFFDKGFPKSVNSASVKVFD
jgi:hypothetical protein